MRRVVPLTALVLIAVMTPGVANAVPHKDSLVGNGLFPAGGADIHVSARSGPSGENAMGDFTRKFDDNSKEKIDVTCLVVTGNRAVAGGPRPGQANPDATFYLIVEDNGPDGDLMSTASTSTPADQAGCVSADIFVGGSLFPVDGDFTVNDAIP